MHAWLKTPQFKFGLSLFVASAVLGGFRLGAWSHVKPVAPSAQRGVAADTSAISTQTFARISPEGHAMWLRAVDDIRNGTGYMGEYIRRNQNFFNTEVYNKAINFPDNPHALNNARILTRYEFIANVPELASRYFQPMTDVIRTDLRRLGFIVEPASLGDYRIQLRGAERVAALTPLGAAINRTYSRYQVPTVADPLLSFSDKFRNVLGAFEASEDLTKRVVHIHFIQLMGTDPLDLRTTSNVFQHEYSHVRDRYNIERGIRSYNAGTVSASAAKPYLMDNSSYAEHGFVMDEVPAHRISAAANNKDNYGVIVRAHAMAAASFQVKLEILEGFNNGSIQPRAASSLGSHMSYAKGTALVGPNGYVIIADINPGNITPADVKGFFAQSIAKSIYACENLAHMLTRYRLGNHVSEDAYQWALNQMRRHSVLSQVPILAAAPEVFGPKLGTPPNPLIPAESPVTRLVESNYGLHGQPQKLAAFEEPMRALAEMGPDFSKPKSSNAGALPADLVARMERIERIQQSELTGETWNEAEISKMPDSGMSRQFSRNLNVSARVSGAVGVVMMSADAVAAIRQGELGEWMKGVAVGTVIMGGAQVGIQIIGVAIGGIAAFNPVGMAFIVGATLGGVMDLAMATVDPNGDKTLSAINWLSNIGSSVGSPLTRFLYFLGGRNPFGANVDAVIAGSRYVPVQLLAQPRETVTAPAATRTPEAASADVINQFGFAPIDLNPGPAVDLNYYLKAPQSGAPDLNQLLVRTKDVRMQIKLRFVCSSWLFLQTDPNTTNPSAANSAACNNYADGAKAYAQAVFTNSGLPVDFTHTAEVESSAPHQQLNDRFTIASGMNVNDRINGINAMPAIPAISVTGTYFTRTSFTETCNPFAPTTCGNNNSTVEVSNYCFWDQTRCNSSGSRLNPPVCVCPGYQPGVGTPPCYLDCACMVPNRQGGSRAQYIGPNGASCPAAPSNPYGGSGRNACGCAIGYKTSVPYRPQSYNVRDLSDSRRYMRSNYPAPAGAWTMTIAVVPFASGGGNSADSLTGGSTTALFDSHTGTILTETGISTGVAQAGLFSNYGYASIALNGPAPAQTLSHYLGHLFGAVHEPAAWGGHAFYNSSYTNLVNREAGAWGGSIMNSNIAAVSKAAFSSSIPIAPELSAYGDYRHNNRNQVIRTLMFLSGNRIFQRPTDLEVFGSYASISQPLPVAAPPPPVIAFTGGLSASYSLGTGGDIEFFTTGIYPVVSANCSLDGGPWAPCTTLSSFRVPSSGIAPGNHTLTVEVTDSSGVKTVLTSDPFKIDASAAILTIINTILQDE